MSFYRWRKIQPALVSYSFCLVAVAKYGYGFLVVTGHGYKGFVGYAPVDVFTTNIAHDRVSILYMVIEKVQWFTRIMRFEPKCDLAELDCQWVEIHAVDTFANNVAHGRPKC